MLGLDLGFATLVLVLVFGLEPSQLPQSNVFNSR